MPTKDKHKFPFRKANNEVIWTLRSGEEIKLSWDDFKEMVKSSGFQILPREEFEQYYKRMKMPKAARDYHKKAKNNIKTRKEG